MLRSGRYNEPARLLRGGRRTGIARGLHIVATVCIAHVLRRCRYGLHCLRGVATIAMAVFAVDLFFSYVVKENLSRYQYNRPRWTGVAQDGFCSVVRRLKYSSGPIHGCVF